MKIVVRYLKGFWSFWDIFCVFWRYWKNTFFHVFQKMQKSDFLVIFVKFFFEKKSFFKNEKKFYIVDSHKSKMSKNGQKSLEIPRGGKWFLAKKWFFWHLKNSNEVFKGISSKIRDFGQKSAKKTQKIVHFWPFSKWEKSS